jgi:hypothetical protein
MADTGSQSFEPVPEGQLRVGDRERHQAATALGDHFATGRLDQQEFDDRVQAAYAARTRDDLQRLFVDLPDPAPFRAAVAVPAVRSGRVEAAAAPVARPWRQPVFVPVIPLLVVLLIVLTAVTRVPFFPLLFVWLWLGCGRRAWRGPRRYAGTRSW